MDKSILRNDKGVSLVLLALSIVILFGFGALAIDVGHLYHVKNQLQAAADAAALAGAANLSGDGIAQTDARDEAINIAMSNFADVSYSSDIPTAPEGEPIPVTLFRNDENDNEGDIVVGNWSADLGFQAGKTPINAVRVWAKRKGDDAAQPQVQNWLAKIFSLIPGQQSDFSLSQVSAVAIAAKESAPFLPIAVNEYWDEAPKHAPGDPYGQEYPQSFMRGINVNGTSGLAGKSFAIVGSRAEFNQSSNDINSFVDILFRNRFHDGRETDPTGPAWYQIFPNTATGGCSQLSNDLNPVDGVNSGDVNRTKREDSFDWLFEGIPDNITPPNAVHEFERANYTDDNYNTSNGNDPSVSPYATIAYFSSSGSITTNPNPNLGGSRFYEKWPKGSKFIVMVYDGSHTSRTDPNQANVITIVGYGLIELDGYLSGPMSVDANGIPMNLNTGGFGDHGGHGTAYGHALPHDLPGESDPYIIEPPAGTPAPDCDFVEKLEDVRSNFGIVRLVDPSLKYGLH